MNVNRQHTDALVVTRSRRPHPISVMTSLPAGKMVPVAYMPMLREDALRATINIRCEMLETRELLANPVNMRVTAYVVPHLAFERFEGSRDQLDRSYMGQPQIDGGDVIPFIETQAMGTHGANAVYKALGLHGKSTDQVNTAILEAYNTIWNFRAKNRSRDLTPRLRLAETLAPAFWQHSRFDGIVPAFDQSVIDGEVALNIVDARVPIRGIGLLGPDAITLTDASAVTADGAVVYPESWGVEAVSGAIAAGETKVLIRKQVGLARPDIFAEMQADGITVSLATIEQARKTQAFAEIRKRYDGIEDEYIIDMLMDGVQIPDQAFKQPILLADRTVRFGQMKRYATDAENLAESAVSGGAETSITLRVPRLNVGGVVMVCIEAVPEQLFERQRDPYLHSANVSAWPEFVRDSLDRQKVDEVFNKDIDTDHATPNATFGYEPMNAKWGRWGPKVGGKFYRPTVDAAEDEERQRIWAVETANPTLAADFYIVSSIHTKPFMNDELEPFEVALQGGAIVEGNTVFGGPLVEAADNYDAIAEKAPTEQIDQDA